MDYPLVCKYKPSVYSYFPIFTPFVGKKAPCTGFRRLNHGFTLVELIVAMAVAGILVSIAIPSMRTFIQNGRLSTQTNELIGDINFARSEAIKRRSNVGICRSTDGVTFAGVGPWRDGRVIFVDTNNDNACNAGELILRFREPLAVVTDTLTTNAAIPYPIIFRANGTPNSAGGVFTFCDDRGASRGRQVTLNTIGQAAVSGGAPGAC